MRRLLAAAGIGLGLLAAGVGYARRDRVFVDTEHQLAITYPHQVSLLRDPDLLEQSFDVVAPQGEGKPKLSFALRLGLSSSATCAVQTDPGKAEFTGQTYFQATTARELDSVGAGITEPRSEVIIDGKPFQRVGFLLSSEGESLRTRIYEHYDPRSRRALVFSLTSKAVDWEAESSVLDQAARSLRLDW